MYTSLQPSPPPSSSAAATAAACVSTHTRTQARRREKDAHTWRGSCSKEREREERSVVRYIGGSTCSQRHTGKPPSTSEQERERETESKGDREVGSNDISGEFLRLLRATRHYASTSSVTHMDGHTVVTISCGRSARRYRGWVRQTQRRRWGCRWRFLGQEVRRGLGGKVARVVVWWLREKLLLLSPVDKSARMPYGN